MEAKIKTPETPRPDGRRRSTLRILRGSSVPAPPVTAAILPEALDDEEAQARARRQPSRWRAYFVRVSIATAAIALMVLAWWAVAVVGNYPQFILPTPAQVGERMWAMALDGTLFGHVWATTLEAGIGFLIAFLVGTSLGYVIGHSHLLERLLSPYIAVTQALPVVAIAPLLAIWFHDDLARKVVVVALIVFFPILVNTIVAVRSIEKSMLEVARISGANFWQTLYYVEGPLGLRSLLGGVKLGLTLAITGAVIGEFVSAQEGLGFLLTLGRGLFDTTLVFVGLVSLGLLTIAAYTLVSVLEKSLITWEK